MTSKPKNILEKHAKEGLVSWTLFFLGAGVITLALITAIVRTDVRSQGAAASQDETAEVYRELFGEELH